MCKDYEVHIVTYKGTDNSDIPAPFFLNEINDSSVDLTGIATIETESIQDAVKGFELGVAWAKTALLNGKTINLHVKLERLLHRQDFEAKGDDRINIEALNKTHTGEIPLEHSAYLAGFDVHMDGNFDEDFKAELAKRDWVVLDYISSAGQAESTLTKHFLSAQGCTRTYADMVDYLKDNGGFTGTLYCEEPQGFQVFGENTPRPIHLA